MERLKGETYKAVNAHNAKIVKQFDILVKLIKVKNSITPDDRNSFRLMHLKNALKIISNFPEPITSSEQLAGLPGIGKGTTSRIDEILSSKTGELDEVFKLSKKLRQRLKQQEVVDELNKVIGIGDNVAWDLVNKYKIKSLDDLVKRVGNGKIVVNDKLMMGLRYLGKYKPGIPRDEMDRHNSYLHHVGRDVDYKMEIIICGSYRRGLPASNDIDVMISHPSVINREDMVGSDVLVKFINYLYEKGYLVDSLSKGNTKFMGFCKLGPGIEIRRIDIRLIPMRSFYTALVYFTGSATFNKAMRSIAKKMGYKLSEYALSRGDKIIPIKSERDLFDKLGMKWLDPSER